MFATTTEVKTITGKIVKSDLIERAQYVLEAFVGKFESEITNAKDIQIMNRATAYQSAYMLNNEDIVFEQMAVSSTTQNDASTTFKFGDTSAPFIAPMALMIMNKLTFVRSRSIKTGKMSQNTTIAGWSTV